MNASVIKSKLKNVLSNFLGAKTKGVSLINDNAALFDIYGREITDGSDHIHPNQVRGIPVFSVDTLMEQHKSYIKRIVRNCGVGDHHKTGSGLVLNDELYVEVIRRYIEYVHLLPASESHHHSVTGGLLVHSFEVSEIAFLIADDMKPETTGMLDVDKRLEPSYKYAAWLGGLLHDAGKVVSDMTIHAVSTYDKETKGNKKVKGDIPSWQPERESLISWARRYSVATYSVTFNKNRIHNQHNFDTSVLFAPIIGDGAALDKILTKPVNIRNELTKVLSGFDSQCEYLKKAIRVGDNKSTGENLKVYQHLKMGPGKLSNAAMVYRAIQWSRPSWVINKPGGHAWVIGDDVYLRYTSAFDVIKKEAEDNGYYVTNKSHGLVDVMSGNNMIERYDENHWSVKYTGGVFTESDINDIRSGKKTVGWESIIKVMWRGVVFGHDPVPDSAPGIMLLPDTEMMILVNPDGTTKEFPNTTIKTVNESPVTDGAKAISSVSDAQSKKPTVTENEKPSTDVKSSKADNKIKPEIKAEVKAKMKPKAKSEDTAIKESSPRRRITFKNDPANKNTPKAKVDNNPIKQEPARENKLPEDVVKFWQGAVFIKNPPKGLNYASLTESAELFGMTVEDLATKARLDGVVVPNPLAPKKVVTLHDNKPCLHVSVSPIVFKEDKPAKTVPEAEKYVAVKPVKKELVDGDKNKAVPEVGTSSIKQDDSSVWSEAKKNEGDFGLDLLVGAIRNKSSFGYVINLVVQAGLGGTCLIQTKEGLIVNASLLVEAIRNCSEYKTQVRTVHTSLKTAEIELITGCDSLFLVPYLELKTIRFRLR